MTIARWQRRTLLVSIATLLLTASTFAYLRQGASVVTVDDALRDFRAAASQGDAGVDPVATAEGDAAGGGQVVAAAQAQEPAAPGLSTTASAPVMAASTQAGGPAPAGPAVAVASRRVAAEGVYVYDTDGHEETDAVGGARHDYPKQTAVTVRHNDCGAFVMRWQPLGERWDESDLCADDGGVAIRRFSTFHEFFQQRQQNDFRCPPGTHVFRWAAAAGATWSWECTDGASVFATTVTHMGVEDLSIGGQTVRAVHMRYDSKMTGANRGIQTQERWLDPDTGLLYKMRTDIDTEADSPFGAVNYQEHYTITLASLSPRT